jgi:peptide-methionine (S)-S-oxide reductase
MPEHDSGRALPLRPSKEHLRKQAKRLAKERGLVLAVAQRQLAAEYGAPNWAALMQRVEQSLRRGSRVRSPLSAAAERGDHAEVRRLLAEGIPADGANDDDASPLWLACASDAPAAIRDAIAHTLLATGANARQGVAGSTPLHAAASRGPLSLVERLIAHGGIEWQPDGTGWSAIDAARQGSAPDREGIVVLLDRPVIADPLFRDAVNAIHAGDVTKLSRLIDAEPRLLRDRIVEPDCYHQTSRPQYFLDPKLLWFVANNPNLMRRMPANIVDVAQVMIVRGVDQSDLQYTLELVMTGAAAREQGHQLPLMQALLAAGATLSSKTVDTTLAHAELEPVRALMAAGAPTTASIAAALGHADALREFLVGASDDEVQMALALAVINGQAETARIALDAGADPNRFMPVHGHSVALHQATLTEDIELLGLLIARGARTDIRDRMWNGTPLDWAIHEGKSRSRAFLEQSQDPSL